MTQPGSFLLTTLLTSIGEKRIRYRFSQSNDTKRYLNDTKRSFVRKEQWVEWRHIQS